MEKWIKDTLAEASCGRFPKLLDVNLALEKPKNGESFEILRATFENEANLWEVKQLLIGSRNYELPGFPNELVSLRTRIHVSRDAVSEKERRLNLQVEGGF